MATGLDRPEAKGRILLTDPLRNFRFLVKFFPYWKSKGENSLQELGRSVQFGFTSVSGLSAATEAIPYREGGMNTTLHQIPGQTTFSPITLSRGVHLGNSQGWRWMRRLFNVQGGNNGGKDFGVAGARNEFRAQVDIYVLTHPATRGNDGGRLNDNAIAGSKNDPIGVGFRVYNAWLQSVAYSDLNAGDNAVLVEQMVLAHEGFEMAWPEGHDFDWATTNGGGGGRKFI